MRCLFLFIALTLSCGEASRAPAAPGGAGGPNVVGMNGGGTGSGGSAGAGGAGGAGGESFGACDNASDLEILASSGNVRDTARDCGGLGRCNGDDPNLNGDVYEGCITACVENDVQGISNECASCYGALERCGLDSFCRLRCQLNTCSPMCLSCLRIAGCTEEFESCRGLEGTECTE